MRGGRGKTVRFIPLHILHERQRKYFSNIRPALHCLTGCDATTKVGSRKAALNAQSTQLLRNFGIEMTITTETKTDVETFLVLVLKFNDTSQFSSFTQVRAQMHHHTKASSHQNLHPTSEGFDSTHHASLVRYILNYPPLPTQYHRFTTFWYQLESECLVPVSGCKTLTKWWTVTCNCGKCARATCPCCMEEVDCTLSASAWSCKMMYAPIHMIRSDMVKVYKNSLWCGC